MQDDLLSRFKSSMSDIVKYVKKHTRKLNSNLEKTLIKWLETQQNKSVFISFL